jgi:hypothetical protein
MPEQAELAVLFLNLNFTRIARLNFGCSAIALYDPGRAHLPVSVFCFRLAKLRSVASPNHDGKYLFWIRYVEVQERWLSFASVGIPRARNLTADRRSFADVILGFSGCDPFCLGLDWKDCDE